MCIRRYDGGLHWAAQRIGNRPSSRLPATYACRRHSSRAVTDEHLVVLHDWIESARKRKFSSTDTLRAEHLSDLYVTLPTRHSATGPTSSGLLCAEGEPLRHGHHLVFFHPRNPERSLRADGTDPEFCPPQPWTRRMWAGGQMVWHEPGLRIGDKVIASGTIDSVEVKGHERGTPMVFVKQKIQYQKEHTHQPAIVEERSHVFLADPGNKRVVRKVDGIPSKPDYQLEYTPSPTTLFRFSALTFNAHAIHLDREYARAEGYSERLVHGPLTALMLLEGFSAHSPSSPIKGFAYRAINPLLVSRPVAVCGRADGKGTVWVWAEDVETKAAVMVGQINV